MSSSRPSGATAQRRPDARKAEMVKIDLTEQHTPLMRLAEQLQRQTREVVGKDGFKSHFICRMKMRNECPGLPFDPKFLAYPSEQNRLTRYACTNLEKNHKHALLTEPDLGIHIDLIEPETYEPPGVEMQHEPEDAALLADEVKKKRPGLEADKLKRPNVPWLQKTSYYGNEDLFQYAQGFKVQPHLLAPEAELETQLTPKQLAERLESSFAAPSTLDTIKHPSKPHLTAVKMWDLMPDWKTWANDYTEVVFDCDPTACDHTVATEMRNEKTKESVAEGDRSRRVLGSTAFMHVRRGELPPRRGSIAAPEEPPKIFGFYLPAPDSKKRKRALEDGDAGVDGDDEESEEFWEYNCVREHQENEARKFMDEWNDDHFVIAFVDAEGSQGGRAVYHPLSGRTYLRKCKDVISFDDLNTLENEDLRSMRRAGHRFPKYFKGSLQVRKLDESTLMSIRERRGEIESTSHRGAAHAINGGGDDEMEDAGPAQSRASRDSSSSPEPEIKPTKKTVILQSSSSSSSSDEA